MQKRKQLPILREAQEFLRENMLTRQLIAIGATCSSRIGTCFSVVSHYFVWWHNLSEVVLCPQVVERERDRG